MIRAIVACVTHDVKNAAVVQNAAATIIHDKPKRPAIIANDERILKNESTLYSIN